MKLLASCATMPDLLDSIERFYCGSRKAVEADSEGVWRVVSPSTGKALSGVLVRLVKGRYRFELVR